MIRVVRTFEAEPGKQQEVVAVLQEISQYASTQGVEIHVLTEPWGNNLHVHIHTDFEHADEALGFFGKVTSNPKGEEAVQRLSKLTSGHVDAAFLTDQQVK